MPQIAQQDYLRAEGKSMYDCHLLAVLAHNIQQGTIFDTVLDLINGDGERELDRVLSYNPDGDSKYIYYCDTVDTTIFGISIDFTQTQYEGLAAIQESGDIYSEVPSLKKNEGYLYIGGDWDDTLTVNGKKVVPTLESGTLKSIEISDVEYNGYDISWEAAQKLLGLPVTDLD